MYSSQNDKMRVSMEAFLEEIHNWELTLGRQQKKLKSLRSHLHSKIHINELEILVTQIEAEILRYRKISDPRKIQNHDIVQEYNVFSKKFMELMEGIGCFADKIDGMKEDHTIQFDSEDTDNEVGKSVHNASNPRYYDQTFTYKVSKTSKYAKNKSRNPSSNNISNKNSFSKHNKSFHLLEASKQKRKTSLNINSFPKNQLSRNKELHGDCDGWQIRYQLKEIKSMMSQIQNQIKYHNHEDIQAELGKIQHNNKKMGLELKGLRDDSQYILTRMQKLKEQLAIERKIQTQMIQEFQNPQRASRRSRGKAASETNNCSMNQQVSDWVKARI